MQLKISYGNLTHMVTVVSIYLCTLDMNGKRKMNYRRLGRMFNVDVMLRWENSRTHAQCGPGESCNSMTFHSHVWFVRWRIGYSFHSFSVHAVSVFIWFNYVDHSILWSPFEIYIETILAMLPPMKSLHFIPARVGRRLKVQFGWDGRRVEFSWLKFK